MFFKGKLLKRSKKLHMFALPALCGALLFAAPHGADAHRIHDPKVPAKVELHPDTGLHHPKHLEGTVVTGGLYSRIHAILHPAEEAKPVPLQKIPIEKTVSPSDDKILGTPLATPEQCVRYLLSVNPHPNLTVSPEELVSYYYEEGGREGIRPDVAFVQALKETGFFRYCGTVTPDQNNYCGLGTTSAIIKGAYFPSAQMGVRAHIQHLLAYAATREPSETVVDPRYALVRGVYGTRTLNRWEDLNGRWAVPGDSYGQSILSMYRALLTK